MEFRKTNIIKEELNDVQELIKLNLNLIEDFPEDTTLKFNLDELKFREDELFDELTISYLNRGAIVKEMIIQGDNVGKGEMPIKPLGELLYTTQTMLTSATLEKSVKPQANIPKSLQFDTNMTMVGVATGSVRILLRKENNTLLPDETNILDESFEKVKKIINSGVNKEVIINSLKNMSEKVAINYRDFLKVLNDNNFTVEFDQPFINKPSEKIFKISSTKAGKIHDILTSKEGYIKQKRINGVIRAIDLDALKFKLKPENMKKTFLIEFDKEDVDIVSEHKVNSSVTIDIKDNVEKTIYQNVKHTYFLKRFVKI